MFFAMILVCVALVCAIGGLIYQQLLHRRQLSEKDRQLSEKDKQISDQRMLSENHAAEMKASYEKRLAEEKASSYKSGLAAARPYAFRSTKEVKGAWRTKSREVALAVVWADGEIRAFAGDVGDLDAFQISPEIKDAIGTFSGAVRKTAASLATTAALTAIGL